MSTPTPAPGPLPDRGFESYDEARRYLYSLRHHGSKYGLDRMRLFAKELGNPERSFPVIHVAGTNGKGSTCALVESIYRHAGYRTGLYTSPHLVFQGERIQVNREILPAEAITAYTNELLPIATRLGQADPDDHPSFFEFMTAMAFLHFAREKVDVAIIEVGLGGRLDATNVVQPVATAITSIGLDHCEILGPTLRHIAREKAGIIKPGCPVILGALPDDAEGEIRAVAAATGAPVICLRERFGTSLDRLPETSLPCRFQCRNAGTALLLAEAARNALPVTDQQIATGLMDTYWPGRWESRLVDGRTLIFDTSHNEEGAGILDENLAALQALGGPAPIILVGALGEARARALLPVAARHARELVLLHPAQPRACQTGQLRACLPEPWRLRATEGQVRDLFPQIGKVAIGNPGDTLVITGSIYLVGEVMEALFHGIGAGAGDLQDLP